MAGVEGVVEARIKSMGSRKSQKTDAYALFLELVPGIRHEMLSDNVTPIAMADKLIAAANNFHPALVEELNQIQALHDGINIFQNSLDIEPIRSRLADRLSIKPKKIKPELFAMGRMVARFVLYGEEFKHFID